MQIHELNTFAGTPGDGNYLAIDNGSDTGKISGTNLLAPVNARIDNLAANVTPDSVVTLIDSDIITTGTYTLSQSVANFDFLDFYFEDNSNPNGHYTNFVRIPRNKLPANLRIPYSGGSNKEIYMQEMTVNASGTTLTVSNAKLWEWDGDKDSSASVQSNVWILELQRVDGVKTSSTTSAELADIRVGANGITYLSAGDAVRGQYSDLMTALTDIAREIKSLNLWKPQRNGAIINTVGTEWEDAGFSYQIIDGLEEGDVINGYYWYNDSLGYTVQQNTFRYVCAYNGDTAVQASGAEYVPTYTVPNGITKIAVSVNKSVYVNDICILKNNAEAPTKPKIDYFDPYYIVITDDTLTSEELPANAKAAGEMKADVDELMQDPSYTFIDFEMETSYNPYPQGGVITFSDKIGYISRSTGAVVNAGIGTWLYSDFIPIDRIDGVCGDFVAHSAVANVAYYSSNDFSSYLNAYLYTSGPDTFSKAEILAGAPQEAEYIIICTNGASKSLYATLSPASPRAQVTITNSAAGTIVGRKYMHISFDDTNNAFADLTANKNVYSSLFDSPFFGCLKELHDTYGAVFSCYCFYNVYTDESKTTLTFSLANAATEFKNEFVDNSDWLRFGFHSIDNYTLYTSATAQAAAADWNTFINRMVDVVGLESIDTLVRLHGFGGSENACVGMRNALCGARGFLCSDYSETGQDKNIDTSTGYYLTNAQATVCGRMGEYYDPTNSLYFYPSNLRLDNIPQVDLLSYLQLFDTADRFNRRRYMIMYAHENQMTVNSGTIGVYKAKLETVLGWAKNNKYIYAYPADLVTK